MAVAGKGELGETTCVDEDGKVKQAYRRWWNMLQRCYDPRADSYKWYGGSEYPVTVCERWLTFANYEQDVKKLDGYDDPEKTSIDRKKNHKDGPDDDGFIGYSPDNCEWANDVQQNNNQRDQKNQRHFVAYPPSFDGDGAGIISNNQRGFARQHGLDQSCIWKCLNERQSTHKGWRFEYAEPK